MKRKTCGRWLGERMVAILGLAMLALAPAAANATTELCLAIDGSGSIDSDDFDLQLEGIAAAVEDPGVVRQDGTITISVVQFSTSARLEVGPTTIDSQATANTVAAQIRAISQLDSSTNIAAGIDVCVSSGLPFVAARQVIDVSTDGQSTTGRDPVDAADDAVTAGVDAINALGVGSGIDEEELESIVRPQPASSPPEDGFVIIVSDFNEFSDAIADKIIAETGPTETSTPTPTATPEPPTSTPTPTPTTEDTATSTPTATPTATYTSTPLPPVSGGNFILRRVRLKGDSSKRNDNAQAVIKGILDVNDPFHGFAPDVIANGLTVLVNGAGGVNLSLSWSASDCRSSVIGASTRLIIKCKSGDRTLKAKFKPVRGVVAPNVFQVRLSARKLDFAPPLTADPVTVVLQTTGGPDRGDTIGETGTCRVTKNGKIASCYETGIFPPN